MGISSIKLLWIAPPTKCSVRTLLWIKLLTDNCSPKFSLMSNTTSYIVYYYSGYVAMHIIIFLPLNIITLHSPMKTLRSQGEMRKIYFVVKLLVLCVTYNDVMFLG